MRPLQSYQGGLTFTCDGLSALNMVFSREDISINDPSYDLIYAARQAWVKSPIIWTTQHVEGHKDRVQSHKLTNWEKLNVQADALAKSFISYAMTQPRHYRVSLAPWALCAAGIQIPCNIKVVYNRVHCKEAYDYWANKGKVQQGIIDYVHWEAIHTAISELPKGQRIFISKHTMGMYGVRKYMLLWKTKRHSGMP